MLACYFGKNLVIALAFCSGIRTYVVLGPDAPQGMDLLPAAVSIQCGNAYGTYDFNQSDTISCKNYGNWKYRCLQNTCHMGSEHEEVTEENLAAKNLFFTDCQQFKGRFGDSKQLVDPNAKIKVLALKYWAQNRDGTLHVIGYPDGNKVTGDPPGFLCTWTNLKVQNNQRPWCDYCVTYDYKEPDKV